MASPEEAEIEEVTYHSHREKFEKKGKEKLSFFVWQELPRFAFGFSAFYVITIM
jgi:heme/copper-type cytochrome/quinol oxidase subunit 3